MKKYYATLGEKDRRRYAAVEAMKLKRPCNEGLQNWRTCQKIHQKNPDNAKQVAGVKDTKRSILGLTSSF
jgi:hypothetical protein